MRSPLLNLHFESEPEKKHHPSPWDLSVAKTPSSLSPLARALPAISQYAGIPAVSQEFIRAFSSADPGQIEKDIAGKLAAG
jgi:hypothetical protein